MPSLFTLQGPTLGATTPTTEPTAPKAGRLALFAIGGAALLGVAYLFAKHGSAQKRPLRGPEMLKVIASEARGPAEYARRIDAWNASERTPLPVAKLVDAWTKQHKGTSRSLVKKLIEDAAEQRLESRERMWTRMSKGLRGSDRDELIASIVKDAAKRTTYRWSPGTKKVFISDVYEQIVNDGRDDGMSLDEFKSELVRLHRAGKINLSRADLIAAMPAKRVEASETKAGPADFHFVSLDGARGLRGDPPKLRVGQRLDYIGQTFVVTKITRGKSPVVYIARPSKDSFGRETLIDARSFPLREFDRQHLKPLDGVRNKRRVKRHGLDGYRVAYGTSDAQGTFRAFDEHTFESLDAATKRMRAYKRQGLWTWVEDDQGNFVPVPGAKSERARKSYPLRGKR